MKLLIQCAQDNTGGTEEGVENANPPHPVVVPENHVWKPVDKRHPYKYNSFSLSVDRRSITHKTTAKTTVMCTGQQIPVVFPSLANPRSDIQEKRQFAIRQEPENHVLEIRGQMESSPPGYEICKFWRRVARGAWGNPASAIVFSTIPRGGPIYTRRIATEKRYNNRLRAASSEKPAETFARPWLKPRLLSLAGVGRPPACCFPALP